MPYGHKDQQRMVEPSLSILKLGMTKVQEYVCARSLSTINLAVLQQMIRECDSLARYIYGPFSSAFMLQGNTGSVVEILTQSGMISLGQAQQLREEFRDTMQHSNSDHGWRFTSGPWKDMSKKAYRSLSSQKDYWGQGATLPMSLYYALRSIDFTDDTLYCEEGVKKIERLHTIIEGLLENHLNDTAHHLDNVVHIASTDRRLGRLVELGHLRARDALVLDTVTNPSANRVSRYENDKMLEPKVLFTEVFERIPTNAQRGFALGVIVDFIRLYDRSVSIDFNELVGIVNSGLALDTPFSLLRPMVSAPTGIPYELDHPWGTAKVRSHWQEISVAAAERHEEIETIYQLSWRD